MVLNSEFCRAKTDSSNVCQYALDVCVDTSYHFRPMLCVWKMWAGSSVPYPSCTLQIMDMRRVPLNAKQTPIYGRLEQKASVRTV